MNITLSQPEDAIFTVSQPSSPLLDAAFALGDYVLRVLSYCKREGVALPESVRQMLLCVQDALESRDIDYIMVTHERFEIVA